MQVWQVPQKPKLYHIVNTDRLARNKPTPG